MARPPAHEWELVGENSDPTPGDPDTIAFLGQDLRDTADAINRRATDIDALASVESWQSKAADAFRNAAGDAVTMLRKAFHRYDVAARALGTQADGGNGYAAAVARTQAAADKALRDAQNADAQHCSLQRHIDQLSPGTATTDPTGTSLTKQQQAAQDDLARARAAVQHAKQEHQNAARAAAAAVRRATTHDGLHDSLIDKIESGVGNADTTGIGALAGIPAAALSASVISIGAGAMTAGTISLAEDAAGPDRYTMQRSGRGGNATEPPKTKQEYADQAKALGYKTRYGPQQVPFDSHGQPAYSNGKEYITPDVDGHNVQKGGRCSTARGSVSGHTRGTLSE